HSYAANCGKLPATAVYLKETVVFLFNTAAADKTLISDTAQSTTDGDTVIHLSVKVDSLPVPGVGAGEPADDYTVVQTNVSVMNSQAVREDSAEASRGAYEAPVAELQNSRENPKADARPEAQPAVFANNACFRLIRGEHGAASVVPCESSTWTTARPTSETRRREPHRVQTEGFSCTRGRVLIFGGMFSFQRCGSGAPTT
ncbi:hypothetical protein V5799_026395, partial [Amblyomma americanum]